MILNIDLVSDFVCPWCFLGAVRLDRALAELRATRPDIEPRINWLPFFLNPDTPPAGEPYRAFLEGKFGGPVKAEAVLDQVREAAAGDGLQYAFERIATRTSATSTPWPISPPPAATAANWCASGWSAAPMPTRCSAWPPDCVARASRACPSSSSTAASACRAHSPPR